MGKDPFQVDLTVEQAIKIIQKNERGRIGIQRAVMVSDWRRDAMRKEERQKKQSEKAEGDDLLESQVLAATMIAAHWKRKVDRRRFLRMRDEEFQFLGMALPPTPAIDQVAVATEIRERRKKWQTEADDAYEKGLAEELDWVKSKKGPDIKADLLEERRQWILDYRKTTGGFPAEFEDFYRRFDEAEEEEEDADKAKEDKKGKGKDAKDKGKKKGKGGAAEEEEAEEHQAGTSELVKQFVEHINEYTEMWEERDESNNFEQKHDVELARKKVFPIVEAKLREVVDDIMKEELQNLKFLYEKAKKKKEKKKKQKKKKEKKQKAKKWCAAVGMISNREDCFPDLVEQGILKKVKPERLENIHGEFQYLGAIQRVQETYCPPPSPQMIKQLVVEHCMLPLASTSIRQKAPYAARSLLLYGPKGSGKSMLARAIATETGATFFDISPSVIEGKYTHAKTGSPLLIYKAFIVAQDCAPSVVYIDKVDEVFEATKGKKKKADANAPNRIQKDLMAAIKQVKTGPESTEQDRILFIGCTSKPYADSVNTKALMDSFDEKVWVSFPEYGSLVVLWQKFMESHGIRVDPTKLNLSSLAHVSEGYSSGAVKQTVDRVLTARRIQQLKNRPLQITEFLGPLSRTAYCWPEEWKGFLQFDHEATGEKARLESLRDDNDKLEGDGGKKEKKKKK